MLVARFATPAHQPTDLRIRGDAVMSMRAVGTIWSRSRPPWPVNTTTRLTRGKAVRVPGSGVEGILTDDSRAASLSPWLAGIVSPFTHGAEGYAGRRRRTGRVRLVAVPPGCSMIDLDDSIPQCPLRSAFHSAQA